MLTLNELTTILTGFDRVFDCATAAIGPIGREGCNFVRLDAQELPDDFLGQDLAVTQGGLWATLTQTLSLEPLLKPITSHLSL